MRIVTLSLTAAILAAPGAILAAGASPAPNYTLTTATYTQDFNTLATAGTSQALPVGFQVVEAGTGAAADGFYVAGTGSSNAGTAYSFGASGSPERALGSLGSGSVGPIWLGGVFTNGLGATIDALAFAYTGEQWRSGSATNDGFTFEYSLNATALTDGTWTNFAGLNYTATNNTNVGALNGNAFATAVTGTITGISIADGQRFGFRWVDVDSRGGDHGIGIDNLSINARLVRSAAVPEPSTWVLLILSFGAVGASLRRRRTLASA